MAWRFSYANTYSICNPSELQVQSHPPHHEDPQYKRFTQKDSFWLWRAGSLDGISEVEEEMEEESLETELEKSKDVPYQLPPQCMSSLQIEILSFLYSVPKSHTGRNEYIASFLLYIWYRDAYVYSYLVQLILPKYP